MGEVVKKNSARRKCLQVVVIKAKLEAGYSSILVSDSEFAANLLWFEHRRR